MGRRLGQHFLSDPAILDRIVDALDPQPDDRVVEIGPGRASLTQRLAPRVGQVVAIERDAELVEELVRAGSLPANVTVVEGDAVSLDWVALLELPASAAARGAHAGFKVVGNIPYYLTSPLIGKALLRPQPIVAVFLIQREVAERLASAPGGKTYGALSVGVQVVAEVERLFVVKPGAFHPPPKVDSVLVRLVPRGDPLVTENEEGGFRRFLAALFSQRRKQLARSLRPLVAGDKAAVERVLQDAGLEPRLRPEVLSPSELVGLYRALDR